jgi:hypothetical protein
VVLETTDLFIDLAFIADLPIFQLKRRRSENTLHWFGSCRIEEEASPQRFVSLSDLMESFGEVSYPQGTFDSVR